MTTDKHTRRVSKAFIAPSGNPAIGEGIYFINDLSLILGLESRKIRRWIGSYWKADFVKDYNASIDGKKRTVNFHSMIEFYVFAVLRENGMPISKIKLAHKTLGEKFNVPYPFASSKLKTDGKELFIELTKNDLVQIGSNMQYVFKKIIDPFCSKITFSKKSGLAESFHPLGPNSSIEVNPKVMFGHPVIEGTRISTEAIYSFFLGENRNARRVASLYEINLRDVRDAVAFHEQRA